MNHKNNHYYLIELQYLGFRYHGWQKQVDVKTVQGMVERTINYVLGDLPFKTLGAGRTDGLVSANRTAFELFTREAIDMEAFFEAFKENLPHDIRALRIEQVDHKFNIIQSAKTKEYLYLFYQGERAHPFAAPYFTHVLDVLDIEKVKQAAKCFEGLHCFEQYCYKPKENTNLVREVTLCEVVDNDIYTANFFPKKSYILRVQGAGFMRHQIRLMMGALIRVGRGEIEIEDLKNSLVEGVEPMSQYIAPAPGLILNAVDFHLDA